jgi:hypothetical protein
MQDSDIHFGKTCMAIATSRTSIVRNVVSRLSTQCRQPGSGREVALAALINCGYMPGNLPYDLNSIVAR